MALEKIVSIPNPGVNEEGDLERLRHSGHACSHKFLVLQGENGNLTLLIGPIAHAQIHKHCTHDHIRLRALSLGYRGRPQGGGSVVWAAGIVSFGGSSHDFDRFDYGRFTEQDCAKIRQDLGATELVLGDCEREAEET